MTHAFGCNVKKKNTSFVRDVFLTSASRIPEMAVFFNLQLCGNLLKHNL